LELIDSKDIVDFIVSNYKYAKKIVEVMIGNYPWIAVSIKKRLPNVELLVTDIDPEKLGDIKIKFPFLICVNDDITLPSLNLYKGADLIYAIRPPPELINEIVKLGTSIKSDVLIRSYSNETCGFEFERRKGWIKIKHGYAILNLLRNKNLGYGSLNG
jgi:uncharacterized UPF0146 family protein